MNRVVTTLAAVGALAAFSAPAMAGPVSGAVIGAGAGAVVAGPPGAVVGGVAGAVIGGPNFYHHHRVHRDKRGRYYTTHGERHYIDG